MSKGGGKTVQTSQTSSPWATQTPYLENLFKRAEGLYGQPTVAAQSPFTQQAIQQRAAEAGPGSLTGQAQNQLSKTLAGDYSNPYSSAALGDMLDMAKARTNAQFGGDNFGSSAHQEWLGRNMTTAAAPYASQLFENERGRQMNAAQMAPGIADAGLGQLQQAGQMQDVYQQRLTDSPWDALQRFQGYTAGNYGGTTVGTQPYQQSNPFADILGTGLAGASLYRMLATPIAAGSDRRLKRDIERVGTHPSGLPLYSFRYKTDDIPRLGVMADEVEKVMPEAVVVRSDGYKAVRYDLLERGRG